MIDGHVHLENGELSIAYVMKFVEEACKRGIDTLQILDHTHRFYEFSPIYTDVKEKHALQANWLAKKTKNSIYQYHALIKEVKRLRLPIQVNFGLEVCYTPEAEPFLSKILSEYPYDFVVGSIHSIGGILYDMPFSKELLWSRYAVDEIYQRYYTLVEQMMNSGLFTQIGHPDTIKLFNLWPTYNLESTYEKLAVLAKKQSLKIEDNTGCYYRYHTKDIGLNDTFLKILLNHQVTIITASDAHYPEHVGAYIKEANQHIQNLLNQLNA